MSESREFYHYTYEYLDGKCYAEELHATDPGKGSAKWTYNRDDQTFTITNQNVQFTYYIRPIENGFRLVCPNFGNFFAQIAYMDFRKK